MIGTGPIYSYNLFPISISGVNWIRLFFFGWRYQISVVPWWGEKTRSCILWCTLTVKFGVIRGRHREIDLHSCLGCWRESLRSTTAQLAKRTWPEAAEKLVSGEAQASDMCLCEDGKTLESLIGLNQPQIPWSTCKGSYMKCQCQSFSTPSSMKPGTSGDLILTNQDLVPCVPLICLRVPSFSSWWWPSVV